MSNTFLDGVLVGCFVTAMATILAVVSHMVMVIPLLVVLVILWASTVKDSLPE